MLHSLGGSDSTSLAESIHSSLNKSELVLWQEKSSRRLPQMHRFRLRLPSSFPYVFKQAKALKRLNAMDPHLDRFENRGLVSATIDYGCGRHGSNRQRLHVTFFVEEISSCYGGLCCDTTEEIFESSMESIVNFLVRCSDAVNQGLLWCYTLSVCVQLTLYQAKVLAGATPRNLTDS